MSEHRRKPSQSPTRYGRRPAGPTPRAFATGAAPARPPAQPGAVPPTDPPGAATITPATGGPSGGVPSGGRPTRAEMRRVAQGKAGGRGRGPAGRCDPPSPRPHRFVDYPRRGRTGHRRWIPSWRLATGCFLTLFGGLTVLVAVAYAYAVVPNANADSLKQGNIFYWSDRSVMARTGLDRQNVTLDQVPLDVRHDFMAAEDETFETNHGVDPTSILRAVKNMATGGSVQSGSTITQQFVKNVYLNRAQTLTRKFNEILIAIKIGNGGLSKDDVLQGYLNTNYYGRGAYGIEAAAQGAFIAATVNEPSTMQYVDSRPTALSRATGRWTYVLNRMLVNHWMTRTDHDTLLATGLPKPRPWLPHTELKGQVGYLADMATNYAEQHSGGALDDAKLAQGGYSIYTTFDKNKVNQLSAAVATMEAAHIDPTKHVADKDVQVGAASVDPQTGAIVAIYGGAGTDKGHYTDNANTQGVPIGSTFKPIVLASAMTNGAMQTPGALYAPITPDSRYDADPCLKIHNQSGSFLPDTSGLSACPEPDGRLHQANDTSTRYGYRSLRFAMEQSINTAYVQLGEDVGYPDVHKQAELLGLDDTSLQYDTAGFYLGTSTPSAVRMAGVYATFDNQGIEHDPFSVSRVTYDGADLTGWQAPKEVRALAANVANTVTDVLKGVVERGTGTRAQALGRPVAGKTGTTDDYKSAWFIGYTPQLATSVVMFKENPHSQGLQSMQGVGGYRKVYGADMPTEVWTDYMTHALDGQPVKDFPIPAPLDHGSNEPGAPSPSLSASSSASTSASASPSTTPSASVTAAGVGTPTTSAGTCSAVDIALGTCTPGNDPTPTSAPSGPGSTPVAASTPPGPPPGQQAQPNDP